MGTELIIAISTAIGGIAAAISVLYAIRNYNRRDEEKLLDQLKVDSVELKNSFQELDNSISAPYFLEIGDNFKRRLETFLETEKTAQALVGFLQLEGAIVTLHRSLALAVEESRGTSISREHIGKIRRIVVRNSQLFPASSRILELCIDLTSRNVARVTSHRFFEGIITKKSITNFVENIGEGSTFEVLLDDFSAIVTDPPMQAMDASLQALINESRIVFDTVCDMLANKSYRELRVLSNEERRLPLQEFRKEKTYTGELSLLLQSIQKYFASEEWNKIWASKTRLES